MHHQRAGLRIRGCHWHGSRLSQSSLQRSTSLLSATADTEMRCFAEIRQRAGLQIPRWDASETTAERERRSGPSGEVLSSPLFPSAEVRHLGWSSQAETVQQTGGSSTSASGGVRRFELEVGTASCSSSQSPPVPQRVSS
jgi:hypothetical protein